jgi:hypothetical protein
MYECDKGKEMNPMEYVSNNGEKLIFTPAKLFLGLKNTTMMKFQNA